MLIYKQLLVGICCLLYSLQGLSQNLHQTKQTTGEQDRKYWYELLYKISYPVIHNLANSTLKKNMPVELAPDYYLKADKVTYLEAVGRTAAGK